MERRLPWQQITSGTALRCQGSNRLMQQQPKWPRCKPAGLFPVLTPAKVFGWRSALWHIMKNKEAILSSSWSTIYIKDFHTVSAVQHPKHERLPFTDAQIEQCGSHTHTHCLPVVSLQQHSKQWKCKWLVLRLHCLPYSASTSAQFYPERSWMLSHFRQTRNLKGERLSVERSWPRRRAELKFPNPACKLSLSPQSCSDAGLQPGREPQLFGSSCHTEQ